jgi:hypothetical protein
MHFNEIVVLLEAAGLSISPYGVIPLEQDLITISREEITPVMGMTSSLEYLAERQHTDVPCTPVRGFAEVELFKELTGQALEERCQSVGNNHTFEDIAYRWNKDYAKGSNRVYKKLSVELALYFKKWSKNQAREVAVKNADVDKLLEGMEFTPRAASAPEPATLRPIIERPTANDDEASMEGVKHGDGGVDGPRGDSYVQMTIEGKATRHCALFPFCLHDVSICGGVKRTTCLFFEHKEPPSIEEVNAEKAKLNTTTLGIELIEGKQKKKAEQRRQRKQKRNDKRPRESTT